MPYKRPNDPASIEARRASIRKHYYNNTQYYKDKAIRRRSEMTFYVYETKRVPCLDCKKEFPPFLMELDHRPNEIKEAEITTLIQNGSWTKLKAEIAKCDVVCMFCHKLRTLSRLGPRYHAYLELEEYIKQGCVSPQATNLLKE